MNGQYSAGDVVFGKWTLVRLIGEGSYGKVFEARREDFGAAYRAAVKIIIIPQNRSEILNARAEGMDEESVTAYFRSFVEEIVREFELMSRLKGTANVVSYEDHEVVPHQDGIGWDILIRMELLTPLLDYTAAHPFTRKDVMKLGMDMCRALELCQKFNIVHRDIKPENIFVSELGDFKLGDFGIARTVEKTTGGLSKKGTYTYMAPEIYRGEAYGSSVDIYSLGIVLYRMLNENRAPFLPAYPAPITHGDREAALAKRLSGAPLPPPKNADGRLAEIVLKACAYDPKERYSSPMQMREELEAILYNREEAAYIYPAGDEAPVKSVEYVSTGDSKDAAQRPAPTEPEATESLFDAPLEEQPSEKTESLFGAPPERTDDPTGSVSAPAPGEKHGHVQETEDAAEKAESIFGDRLGHEPEADESAGKATLSRRFLLISGIISAVLTAAIVVFDIAVCCVVPAIFTIELFTAYAGRKNPAGKLATAIISSLFAAYFLVISLISGTLLFRDGAIMAIRNIAYIGSFGMVAALNYGAYRRKTSLAGTKKRAIRLILILMTLIAAMDMAVALDSTGEIGSYLLGRGADAGTANVIVKTDYNADGSTAGWREYSCDKNGNTLSVKYCDADGSVYFTGYSAERDEVTPADWYYEYEYDSNGNCIRANEYDGSGSIENWYEYEYDENNNCVEYTQYSDGQSYPLTQYRYDESGNLVWQEYADSIIEYTYDADNHCIERLPRQYEDGEVGNRHEYKYDDNGNCIQEIVYNPGADTTTVAWSYSYSYVFDQSGRMIKKTTVNDNRSDSVVYEYDQNGKCIKATYENDSSVGGWSEHQWEYNEEGLLCRETVYNVGGLVFWWHEFEYDMNHRLIRETWHNVNGDAFDITLLRQSYCNPTYDDSIAMYKKLPEEDATPSETINSVTFSNMYVDLASANGFEGYSGENVFWLTADITSSQQTDIRSIGFECWDDYGNYILGCSDANHGIAYIPVTGFRLPVCALNEDGELVDASGNASEMEIGETYYWKAYVTLEDGQYYESSVQSFAL